MNIPLNKILSMLDSINISYEVNGDNICVNHLSAVDSNVENSLCYYAGCDPAELSGIRHSVIICKPELKIDFTSNNSFIYTSNPQLSYYHLSELFGPKYTKKVFNNSIIDTGTLIGENVSIGPFCHIENCNIGNNVIIDSGVKIYFGCQIGDRVHIESNSVIGATGVMWAWDTDGNKILLKQTGRVIIDDDVFIGSNITIVRGAYANKNTIIGKGTMIAHGTMIGHGCRIGTGNHFANNISLGGSVKTGRNCFFGSGSVVRPNTQLGDEIIIGAGAVVVNDFLDRDIVIAGNPAKRLNTSSKKKAGVPLRP